MMQATIRQALVPGPTVKPGELWQGLGLMIGGKDGSHYMEHGGSGVFQDDRIAYFQNRKDGLVVMVNGNAGELVDEVFRGASTVYEWPDYKQKPHPFVPFDAATAGKFVGNFGPLRFDSSPDGFSVELPAGSPPERVYADGPNHFFILEGPQEFTFSNEVNGRMQSLRFVTPMADIHWKRADSQPIGKY
jgi:hypothetical protein